MFQYLSSRTPRPRGLPDRAHGLTVLARVLDGSIYDTLPHGFHDERNGAGEYVPLRDRAPSVRYGLCRLVVEDSVAFLFGEGRFPAVECEDRPTHEALARVLEDARASEVFTEAALAGSVGSVAVRFRVLRGRVFLDAMPTVHLTPEHDPEAPDTLLAVREAYQVRGRDLAAAGYAIKDDHLDAYHWFRREWTATHERWFIPQLEIDAQDGKPMREDAARTVQHGLGFVPVVWIRNLPGGAGVDGACTFRAAIETAIEIDYQLSQGGRALKYAADPLLMIREPAGAEGGGEMVRSAGNALVVSEGGDAKLVEINGTASAAVIEYCRHLRELALESVHGNRAKADKLGAAQSGRAMELLYAPLLNLADKLRTSYGGGLLEIARMVVRASALYPLVLRDGERAGAMKRGAKLTLRWPSYFPPTQIDLQNEATTLGLLRQGGHMSQETAVRRTAASWDINDVDTELAAIVADKAEAQREAQAVAAAGAKSDPTAEA